jgi:hypothetical protein
MPSFFENKFTLSAIAILFVVALAWNNSQGAAFPAAGLLLIAPAQSVAHGPNMPPDPWDGNLAAKHGPNMPPDPWDGNLAAKHGPNMPPDPWDGNLAAKHGPNMPPDPWDGNVATV